MATISSTPSLIKIFVTNWWIIIKIILQLTDYRHGSDITLDVGVTAKRLLVDSLDKSGMGLVTSPDGDSHIILNSKNFIL